MGANNGTGYPYWLRCSKCRSRGNRERGWSLHATGRTRPLARGQRGRGNSRATNRQIQIVCGDCGHVGWTRHKHAEDLLLYARKKKATKIIESVTLGCTVDDLVEIKWRYVAGRTLTRIVTSRRMQGIYEAAMKRLQSGRR
jgi:hypothetical protein